MKPGYMPAHHARIWAAFVYSSIFQATDPASERIATVYRLRHMTAQLREVTEALKAWNGP